MICATPPYHPPQRVPHYELNVRIPARGDVTGTETVTFHAPRATSRIVLRMWANGEFTRARGARETAAVTFTAPRARRVGHDPTTVDLRLARPVARGDALAVKLRFRLRLAGGGITRVARGAAFVRLGSFFPILALDRDGRWATEAPSPLPAETSTSPTADFEAHVAAPRGWTVVTTGNRVGRAAFNAHLVRDFAIGAGRFARASVTARAPSPVKVTVVAPRKDEALAFVGRVALSLQSLARRYGPYPWRTMNAVVTDDLGTSGIEYPNLTFIGTQGLRVATPHEVAHQWFYSLVGNDQARDPWLDEGLASWAMTRVDSSLDFVFGIAIPPSARGHLTAPMTFWASQPQSYFAGIYAQGAVALASLGDRERTDCALKAYVARNAYGIATTADLLSVLRDRLPASALARFSIYTDRR